MNAMRAPLILKYQVLAEPTTLQVGFKNFLTGPSHTILEDLLHAKPEAITLSRISSMLHLREAILTEVPQARVKRQELFRRCLAHVVQYLVVAVHTVASLQVEVRDTTALAPWAI